MTGYYYSGIWRSIYRLPCLIIGTVKLVDITEQSLGIPLQYGIVCSRVSKGQDVPLSLCPGIKSFLVQLSLCPRTRAAAKNSVTNSFVQGQNHYLIDKKNFIKNCSFFTLFFPSVPVIFQAGNGTVCQSPIPAFPMAKCQNPVPAHSVARF